MSTVSNTAAHTLVRDGVARAVAVVGLAGVALIHVGSPTGSRRCRRWESNPHAPKGTGF